MWSHHILRLVVILAQDISNKLQNQGKGAEWWSWNSMEFWSCNLAVVCQKMRAWPKMSCRWTAVNEAQAFSSSLSIHRNTQSVHLQKNKRQPVGTALGPPSCHTTRGRTASKAQHGLLPSQEGNPFSKLPVTF